MIRINLLPLKAAQKKERLREQLILLAVVVALAIGGSAAAYAAIQSKIGAKKDEIAQTKAKIEKLKVTIGEVKNFEKLQEDLRGKLALLEKLKTAKSGPVRILDALSKAIPEKLWLVSFKEKGGKVDINGLGFNEEAVAQFMRNLEASTYFSQVELKVIEQTMNEKQKLHKFDIVCQTESPAAK